MSILFRDLVRRRVVVFDGAMGTAIQAHKLTAADFGGSQFEGCNEQLNLTRPDVIESIHAEFFTVGCDVVETNTFGANFMVLGDYDLMDQVYESNRAGAHLAKKVAQTFTSSSKPCFVAGSIGPGTRLPSLGQITFSALEQGYQTQVRGLIDGGVDLLVIETCQDILQTKAALNAALAILHEKGQDLPIIIQITLEKGSGTMLVGTDISAALTVLAPYAIDAIGINCATGPADMREAVHFLSQFSPKLISVQPNAGMPENVQGTAVYPLQPDELAEAHRQFVENDGVNIIGGCCGTTTTHLEAVVKALKNRHCGNRSPHLAPAVASLYQSVPLAQTPRPLIIGERANANGSKQFRELLLADEYDRLLTIGKTQEQEGAHVLDVCVAYTGRNEERDMMEVIRRFNEQLTLPLMIDSTEPAVIESALQFIGGRAIINSINLEDGEKRLEQVLPLCKKYGTAVVALTIDEEGMALTTEKKLAIAHRIYRLATERYGLRAQDLIFDPLTFTLANPESENAALSTLNAITRIKSELPDCFTLLGVSNISFGMNPYARIILNSVFLYYAIAAGLDAAIVNYRLILPLNQIPAAERELAKKLIFNEKINGDSALLHFIQTVGTKKPEIQKVSDQQLPAGDALKNMIINGDKENLESVLTRALQDYSALTIINHFLLAGMKEVGELFSSGQMQLPFVLRSAEVMKTAVKYLTPYLDRVSESEKGRIVLATVKGDVHDIGKNLVDIILTNNGYKVYNLGIKVPLNEIWQAAEQHQVHAIGMSGLLVKSSVVMKENLAELNRISGGEIPIIVGGAALTEKYVNETLASVYKGKVYYAADIFDGLAIMEKLVNPSTTPKETVADHQSEKPTPKFDSAVPPYSVRNSVSREVAIPTLPFYGSQIVNDLDLDEIYPYINTTALFHGQWQYRKRGLSEAEYDKLQRETIEPIFDRLKQECKVNHWLQPKLVYGYFYCQSQGNELIIFAEDRKSERLRFQFPRQNQSPFLCIADYFADKESGKMDVLAMQLVTIGEHASEVTQKLHTSDQYTDYLYLHGLSVETAEALAEYWHKHIRQELGIDQEDAPDIRALFRQQYRGVRYSLGYPACPNLADQIKIFELLQPERIGVQLSENFMLIPEQSTSAIIVHHPEAKYFSIR